MRVLKSSDSAKKILVRSPCSSVRQDSPGSVERSELMLCVATMGMHLALRTKRPIVRQVWKPATRVAVGR